MITTSIILIKVLLLAHLLVKFEPIGWVFEAVANIFNKNKITQLIYNILLLALSCFKCCSFWLGWILGGFWIGVTAFTIAYFYTNLLMPFVDKIRFQ